MPNPPKNNTPDKALAEAIKNPALAINRLNRDELGRRVRKAWVRWAEQQPNPKPSWLLPYDELAESDKEVDRQIGVDLARIGAAAWVAENRFRLAALSQPQHGVAKALRKCRDQFEFYVQSHLAKIPPDMDKAATNQEFVELCDEAIASLIAVPDGMEWDRRTVARCIQIVRERRDDFLDPDYASDQPVGSFVERFAADQCAEAIENEFAIGTSEQRALLGLPSMAEEYRAMIAAATGEAS